jgi:NAD(P)-dependent dehydrogenase (short-subunit alcohol dehydrogenase family)
MVRTIVISGSSGNLGKAVSRKFVSEGYQVIGLDAKASTNENGVDHFECDLTSLKATHKTFETIKDIYGKIHAGIFLVGGFDMGTLESTRTEDLEKMMSLNFYTAFHASKEAYAWMKETEGGKIILVGARPAIDGGSAEVLAYSISKSAVIKLAEIINETGGQDNIQAAVIVPSIIDTPVNRSAMPDADFKKWVTPEAIAESIYFLVSDAGVQLRNTFLKIYGNS